MKKARIILTEKDNDKRLYDAGVKEFVADPDGAEGAMINIYANAEYQEIEGFGGAFTEAASTTIDKLSDDLREEILKAYFDPKEGIGYTLCRTHINSCDFALGNYSYVEDDDVELKTFDIARDKQSLLPLIKDAQKVEGAEFKMFASPWSPPAWMKDTKRMNRGGKLLPEYRETWAKYFAKYIKAYAEEGVDIWGVTVQNEPKAVQTWDSCVYTGQEEGEFVAKHLGPILEDEGLGDVKIMVWDHNKERLVDRFCESMSVEGADKYIWGGAFHWYSGDHFEAIDVAGRLFPDKKWLFSEGCVEHHLRTGEWSQGERYGHDIMGNLNHGACGFTDWNIVLNEMGGPNHVQNYCDAPIMADTKNNSIAYQISYYYMGHFSKYIRPGAKRIGSTTYTDKLEATAFKNEDGSIAVVVMNRTDEELPYNIRYEGDLLAMTSAPHSIATLVIE